MLILNFTDNDMNTATFPITVNEVPVYCLPILRQILTRGSLRAMVKNVDPNYDAYRRQKPPIKNCFVLKYVCVYEVRCRIVALKSIFCPILRRPRLEMKRS